MISHCLNVGLIVVIIIEGGFLYLHCLKDILESQNQPT